MRTVATIILMIPLVMPAACALTTRFSYYCEGKCVGELGHDLDANSPEQLDAQRTSRKHSPGP